MEASIYGEHEKELHRVMEDMIRRIDALRSMLTAERGMDPIEHVEGRVKSDESMRAKCRRLELPETAENALGEIFDAIGIRIVCAFINDIYVIRDHIASFDGISIIREKDYVKNAKDNGYRSYHMILKTEDGYHVEIQLRTISMDTWAALEHHMRYKKVLPGNRELIGRELKRCADELASTDVSMQAIRDLIDSSAKEGDQ